MHHIISCFLCIIIPFFLVYKSVFLFLENKKELEQIIFVFTNSNSKKALFRISSYQALFCVIRLYAGRTPDIPRHRHYACCLTQSFRITQNRAPPAGAGWPRLWPTPFPPSCP